MFRNFTMGVCAAILVASFGAGANAQSSTVSLDLFYSDPSDTTSAGTWQLYATADSEGLSGIVTRITGIIGDPDAEFLAPTGPGFQEFFNGGASPFDTNTDNDTSTLDILIGQVPIPSPGPQTLLYDAGALGGTTPLAQGELGTAVDTSGSLLTDAVLLAFGRFGDNSTPAFAPGATQVNVFTVEGTVTDGPLPSTIVIAALTTQVRSNALGLPGVGTLAGDATLDRDVNGFDVNLLAPNFGQPGSFLYQGGDFTGDKTVNGFDVNLLAPNFGFSAPLGGLSAVVAVPEPTGIALVAVALTTLLGYRRKLS